MSEQQEVQSVQLDPRKRREAKEEKVRMLDGTFIRCRKVDMAGLVLSGRFSMPILTAVMKMIEMPRATPLERLEALGENKEVLFKTLQEHACSVAIGPRVVAEDTGDPSTVPVAHLELAELMEIWVKTAVLPRVGAADAATFRSGGGADDVDAAPPRESVPAVAEQLPAPVEREYIGQ